MNDSLPQFKRLSSEFVHNYIARVLSHSDDGDESSLLSLVTYGDGHYRAVFRNTYFTLASGETEPTKSQWNTLKKKMKRHHKGVFIFKEHGTTDCSEHMIRNIVICYYIDFGFFAH